MHEPVVHPPPHSLRPVWQTKQVVHIADFQRNNDYTNAIRSLLTPSNTVALEPF